MKLIGEIFKWFLYITTGILIVTAIAFGAKGEEMMPVNTLWKILLAGFLTTVVTVGFKTWKDRGVISYVLHYMSLCLVMVVCGGMFGWIPFSVFGVFLMMFYVAAVYGIAFVAYWLVDRKQAEEINKLLEERYKDEE